MDTPRPGRTRVRCQAVKAIVVSCPHCGARLQVKGDAREVKCEYCETPARVQRRTQLFERALPPPIDGPRAVAIQRHTKIFVWVMVLTTVVPLLFIGPCVYFSVRTTTDVSQSLQRNLQQSIQSDMQKQLAKQLGGSMPTGSVESTWQGTESVLLADVDGNGSHEILGRTRRVRGGDVVRVIALEGATGQPRWETEDLGTYSDTYQGRLSIMGDTLVFGSPRGDVRAFALATGKPVWQAKIDERVKYFCDGGNGVLLVVGNDNVARAFQIATGAAAPAPAVPPATDQRNRKRPPCSALPSDGDESGEPHNHSNARLGEQHELQTLRLYRGPAGRVLAGRRAKGTGVATLVLLDEANAARWKVVVPQDPLAALEYQPEPVALGANEVCAAYHGDSTASAKRVACFTVADGKRRWDVSASSHSLDGMAIHNRALLMWSNDAIELRSLDSGSLVWRFGR